MASTILGRPGEGEAMEEMPRSLETRTCHDQQLLVAAAAVVALSSNEAWDNLRANWPEVMKCQRTQCIK